MYNKETMRSQRDSQINGYYLALTEHNSDNRKLYSYTASYSPNCAVQSLLALCGQNQHKSRLMTKALLYTSILICKVNEQRKSRWDLLSFSFHSAKPLLRRFLFFWKIGLVIHTKSPRRHFKMYSQEAVLEELSFVEMKTKLEPEQRAVYTNSNS